MSDRINQLIESVREKSMSLKDQVSSEKRKNEELLSEIQELNQKLTEKDDQISELNGKISALNASIEATHEQNIRSSDGNPFSNEQIDELVKEIEYCIGQLKK